MPIFLPIHTPTPVAAEHSLQIFIDIIGAEIVAAQASSTRRYTSRLLVDSVEIPIRSATLEARKDSLGTELRVVLAIADRSQVSFTSTINFDLGLWISGAWTWIPLLAGGKLSSVENAIRNEQNAPNDSVSISVVDVIADRWNRAPRAPIHLYDSNISQAPSENQIASQQIELQTGGVIVPVNTAIPDMTLQQVLEAAYVTGVGFDEVVTNIPNFPVPEADFTLEGGYDAGVRPLLTLFAPLLFERNNVLFIIDPDGPLPAGFVARSFPESDTRELTDSTPQREPVNALLLRLKSGTGAAFETGDYFTDITTSVMTPSGTPGTSGYTETTVDQSVRTYRNLSNPNAIVRQEVIGEVTTVTDWESNIIEVTELSQAYDSMNRKISHVRRVHKRMPNLTPGDGYGLVQDVSVQTQRISYMLNPLNTSEYLQDTVNTVESGLILVDPSNQYIGQSYRIPFTDAHVSAYVDPSGDQFLETGDIKTTIESLRVIGQQVQAETRVVNHLANTVTQTSLTTRPGGTAINTRGQAMAGGAGGGRLLMITVPGTDALGRRAQVYDANFLPREIAIQMAERKLRRLNSPPRQLGLSLAFPDIGVRRGTLLSIEARGEVIGQYLCEGYSISFQPNAVSMNATLREIKT